ncbi:hypothetical protein QYM36_011112, partial [Artemia franciscana]
DKWTNQRSTCNEDTYDCSTRSDNMTEDFRNPKAQQTAEHYEMDFYVGRMSIH